MKFIIQKESFNNSLRLTEKITAQKTVQPVLSNVLIETVGDNSLKFSATDLDLAIELTSPAVVNEKGSITLPAKKLNEIISKLPDKPVSFELNEDTNVVSITCGNSKFDIVGISSSEFPELAQKELLKDKISVSVKIKPFLKAVKQTVFSTASYDTNNILSGVFCKIFNGELEMAATDGNRLSRVIEKLDSVEDNDFTAVIPSKTLNELLRFTAGFENESMDIIVKKGQILFKMDDRFLASRLLEGQYPKYQQLIPEKGEKTAVVDREALIVALDRVSTMVNERTSIVKFTFSDDKLLLKADTSDAGASMDLIDINYKDDELMIAFNYRYILDSLKIMDSEKVRIDLNTPLSATVFKPQSDDNYICLVMPVQIR